MPTCSLGPNPDVTSTILALLLSLRGVLFSLSSCASDGEPSFFKVLTAELELSVLEAPVPVTLFPLCVDRCMAEERERENKQIKRKSHIQTKPNPIWPNSQFKRTLLNSVKLIFAGMLKTFWEAVRQLPYIDLHLCTRGIIVEDQVWNHEIIKKKNVSFSSCAPGWLKCF